jgi:hypothetical protein
MRQLRVLLCLGFSWLTGLQCDAGDWVSRGRDLEDGRDFSLRLTGGQIVSIEAFVKETTRKLYDVTGSTWKQADAEDYSLSDFDMDSSLGALGVSMEKAGRYFSFQLDAALMNPETDTVARRNYYIEVSDVTYQGQEYDQMKIPEGTPFSAEALGFLVEARMLFSPVTLRPVRMVRFTPWFELGLFGFIADYDINAGPAQGLVQYQNPPEYFVIGGHASGYGGLGLPQIGLGGELRLGDEDTVNVVLQANYGFLEYDGSTRFLTVNRHREKNVDLEHTNLRLRALLEFPFKDARCFTFGFQYQSIESDAFISSTATDPEEILARQERFDKEVAFSLEAFQVMAGYTF